MPVNVSKEELDLFKQNGISPRQISDQVNFYRGQGLSDSAIRSKIDTRLGQFRSSLTGTSTMANKPKPTISAKKYPPATIRPLSNPMGQVADFGKSAYKEFERTAHLLTLAPYNHFTDKKFVQGTNTLADKPSDGSTVYKTKNQLYEEGLNNRVPTNKYNRAANTLGTLTGGFIAWAPFGGLTGSGAKAGLTQVSKKLLIDNIKKQSAKNLTTKQANTILNTLTKSAYGKPINPNLIPTPNVAKTLAYTMPNTALGKASAKAVEFGAKHPYLGSLPAVTAENAMWGAGMYGVNKAAGNEADLKQEMINAQLFGHGIHAGIHGGSAIGKRILATEPVQNALAGMTDAINNNPTVSNAIASVNNFLNLNSGIKAVSDYQKLNRTLATNPELSYQQTDMINRLNQLSPEDLAVFQEAVQKGALPEEVLAKGFGEKPEQGNVIDEAFEDALAEKYFGKPINVDRLNRIEQAIDNGTPVTKEAIDGVAPAIQQPQNYRTPEQLHQEILSEIARMNKEAAERQAAETAAIQQGVEARRRQFEELINQNKEQAPQHVTNSEFNPADDINLFNMAREQQLPRTPYNLVTTKTPVKVRIPKVKPNTKRTLAEWKERYSTTQNEPSIHPQFVDRTYSKEELRNLPVEEFNAIRAKASQTLKMDATTYNNTYGKPYTKQALKRVKQTFNNAEDVYKERYSTEIKQGEYNEGGSYNENWETVSPKDIKKIHVKRKYEGSTNTIKPSKVSHSENYDISNPEYKGIEGTEGYKVTKLEAGKAEGSDYKAERNTTGAEPDYYEGVPTTNEYTPEPEPKSSVDTSELKAEAKELRNKAKKALKSGNIKKSNKFNRRAAELENTIKEIEERNSLPDYKENYKADEGYTNEKELRDAYDEDIKENMALDSADIEERQRFFDEEQLREENGESYKNKESKGTVYDEGYERGEYGEAENIAENEAEIYKDASDEFRQFWKEYRDVPKEDKTNFLRQYVLDMPVKSRRKLQEELVEQEDFLAKKYEPKRAGEEFVEEYNYYNEGEDTQALAEAIKPHSSNRAEQIYGDSLDIREQSNVKSIESKKQHQKSIEKANRFMIGKSFTKPTSMLAVSKTQGKFNINHGNSQKTYDSILRNIKGSKLDITAKEHAFKVLNRAAEKFNKAHQDKAITIERDVDLKPVSAETKLDAANKSGDLAAGYNILKYNKKLKSTDLGEEHYRQSQEKMLNETLPKLKEELSELESDLAKAKDQAEKDLIQYKIDSKKLEMHEQAMERGQQGINYYRNFDRSKAEMSSFNRETGKYEKKGVPWDRHSGGLRQSEYEAVKRELESYSLTDAELDIVKKRIADYEKNAYVELSPESISRMKDEDYVKLVTERPHIVRRHMDKLPEGKQQEFVASVYNKALTTGKGLAILEGKSTTVKDLANAGNKLCKDLVDKKLGDTKVVFEDLKSDLDGGFDIDTKEIVINPKSSNSAFDHEIAHLEDYNTPEGKRLLDRKFELEDEYADLLERHPGLNQKASKIVKEKELSKSKQIWSKLKKEGFSDIEIKVLKKMRDLKNEYKLLEEITEGHAEAVSQARKNGETNVQNIQEYIEGKASQEGAEGRKYQKAQEISRGKVERRGAKDSTRRTNRYASRRRLVAKKQSTESWFKEKFGDRAIPWKREGKPVNKEVEELFKYFKKISEEGTEKAVKYDIDLAADQALYRQKLKSGGEGLAVYFPRRGEGKSEGIDLMRDYAKEHLDKVGLYGEATKDTPQAVTARDGMNLISMNNKRDWAIDVVEQIKNHENTFEIPDIKGYDYNKLVKPGYVPVNSSLIATALFGGKSKAFVDTLRKGEIAISKAFPEAEANHWIAYMNRHEKPDIQIPKTMYDRLFSGRGETPAEYTMKYCQQGQIHGDLGKLYSAVRYARAYNKVFLDLFKRDVLTSNSFVMNNRLGNSILLAMSSENPQELIDAFKTATQLKDSDVPKRLLGSQIVEALQSSKGKRLTITGETEIDNFLNALYGNGVDLSKITKTIKVKGVKMSSKNSLNQEAKTYGDIEIPNKDYTKQMIKGRVYNTIAGYQRGVNKIKEAYTNFNEKGYFTLKDNAESLPFGENFERKIAYARGLNKVRKQLIKDTGNKFITQTELLKHVKEHPEIEESIIQSACDALGDYNTFSRFEQDVLKQVIPFYSWLRTISRHVVKNSMKYPTRYALFAVQYHNFMENEKYKRKSFQRGIFPLDRHDPRSGEQLGINLISSTGNPYQFESPLQQLHPLVYDLKFLIKGEHDIGDISSNKYMRVGFGDNAHIEDREGNKYDKLPVSARINSLLMTTARRVLFTNNKAINFEQLAQAATTGKMPDKQYEDFWGGYRHEDKFNDKHNRYVYNHLSNNAKYLNWVSGNKLQAVKPLNKAEKKKLEEEKLNKTRKWRDKFRKK